MAEKATKVRYDTSEAIDSINKLNAKVKKAGATAKKSFTGSGKGLKDLGNMALQTNGKMASMVGTAGQVAAAVGTINPVVLAVTGAVIAAAASFVDWGEAGRKAIDGLASAGEKAQRRLREIQVQSDRETSQQTLAAKQRIREITQIQAEARIEDAKIKLKQAGIQREIIARKDMLAQMVKDEKAAAMKIADARDAALSGSGRRGAQLDRQLLDLLDRAEKAGRQGDVERQQKLLDSVRDLSKDADRPDFFMQRVFQQEDRIQKQPEGAGDQKSKKRMDTIKEEIRLLEKRNRLLTIQSSELQANTKALRGEKTQLSEYTRQIEAASDVADAEKNRLVLLKQITDEIGSQRSATEEYIRILQLGKSKAGGVSDADLSRTGRALAGGEQAAEQARAAIASKDAVALEAALKALNNNLDVLSTQRRNNDLTGAAEFDVKRLESVRKTIETAIEQGFTKGIKGRSQFTPAAEARFDRGEAPAAPGERDQASTNVTINANIKGGAFDADTLKKFTEIAAREVRKATQELA